MRSFGSALMHHLFCITANHAKNVKTKKAGTVINAAARNAALARCNLLSVFLNHLKRFHKGSMNNPGAAKDTAAATAEDLQSVIYLSEWDCPGGVVLLDVYLLQVSQPPGHPYVLAMNPSYRGE